MIGGMVRAFIFLTFAAVLLTALALISVLSVEDKGRIRGLPRFAWVLLILLVPLLGAVAYFVAGRPVPTGRASGWRLAGGAGRVTRPRAPDDDPDFLRSLEQPSAHSEESDLRRWEEELRRKDDA
jgi:hypothetical protein